MIIAINGEEVKLPSGGTPASEVYSTEETRIGTWIDGKPLYRKVLSSITPQTNLTEWIDISNLNIDVVTRTGGTIRDRSLPFLSNSIIVSVWVITSKKYLAFYTSENDYKGIPVHVVLEYTKTTDTEVTV